jgi:hypothetical protein
VVAQHLAKMTDRNFWTAWNVSPELNFDQSLFEKKQKANYVV